MLATLGGQLVKNILSLQTQGRTFLFACRAAKWDPVWSAHSKHKLRLITNSLLTKDSTYTETKEYI